MILETSKIQYIWDDMKKQVRKDGKEIVWSPYKFLRAIGWDKFDYDMYSFKLKAGKLSGEALAGFTLIYNIVQDIIADAEQLSIRFPKCAVSCEKLRQSYTPGYGNQKQVGEYYTNIEKAKYIKESENISGIKIIEDGNTN